MMIVTQGATVRLLTAQAVFSKVVFLDLAESLLVARQACGLWLPVAWSLARFRLKKTFNAMKTIWDMKTCAARYPMAMPAEKMLTMLIWSSLMSRL